MYTYTGNNPVNFTDPTGHRRVNNDNDVNYGGVKPKSNDYYGSDYDDMISSYNYKPIKKKDKSKLRRIVESVSKRVNEIKEDKKNFDINNTDEDVVLDSNWISGYKGVGVIRNPFGTSFAIGSTIFLNKNHVAGNKKSINTVKHEYGHTIQEDILGFNGYISKIAKPSFDGYRNNVPTNDYFSQPWERGADHYGGVTNRKFDNGKKYKYTTTTAEAMDYMFDRTWNRYYFPE